MADVKGKGKAVDPVAVSDDDDDLTALFTSKRTTLVRPAKLPPRKARPSSPPAASDHFEIISDESDAEAKKQRRKKKKDALELPAWATQGDSRGKRGSTDEDRRRGKRGSTEEDRRKAKRGSTEEEQRKGRRVGMKKYEVVDGAVILSDSDEDEPAPARRATPPPALSPEEREAFQRQFLADLERQSALHAVASTSSPAKDEGPSIVYTITMVVDPERKKVASERAIQAYEKPKMITIGRNMPLSRVIEALAKRIEKSPDEIVLVYRDRRVYNTGQSARELGVSGQVAMQGFEKAYYEQHQRALRERRQRELEGLGAGAAGDCAGDVTADADGPAADDEEDESDGDDDGAVSLRVRGERGEVDLHVRRTETAHRVCRIYCRKLGVDPKIAERMRLVQDGDAVEPGTTLAEMDVEDDELLDVRET